MQTPTVAPRSKFMTGYRQRRKDILKFRFQLLISKFISHRHGRHSIGAHQQAHIHHPPIASPRVRANFIRHTRRFFSDSAGYAPREEERTGPETMRRGTERSADCICTVVSHVAPAETGGVAREDSVRSFVRSLSASYYYSTVGHTLSQRASFTYRDSPRMRRRRRT